MNTMNPQLKQFVVGLRDSMILMAVSTGMAWVFLMA